MKKIVIFHFILVFFSIIAQADVYVKGILHFEGSYRYGINVPGADVVNEWWFGKNKITFISTGWRFKVDDVANNTDMRFTLDKEKQCFFVVNLKEKFYAEIPLPINLLLHMDKSIADSLKNYQINGDIKKTGKRETINQKVCDVYKVSEWISYGDIRFYDRDRTIMTTTDVPFNWKLANELFRLIRSFFNPQETYLSELKKMKGFVMAAKHLLFNEGYQVKLSFKIVEISNKKPPKDIYDIPQGFRKKEKLNFTDLDNMISKLYVFHYY